MKKTVLILIVLLASCKGSVKEFHQSKPDTAMTVLLYLSNDLQPHVDRVYRVVKDTFLFDTLDAETAKKIWNKDTAYYVPVLVAIRDTAGKIISDSLGKPKQVLQFRLLRTGDIILQDYNKRL